MKAVVFINGKKQTRLSVFDRLTQFGDGLFETCVVKQGQLLFWSVHFSRLEKGRKRLKIAKITEQQWIKDITKAVKISALDQAVVKIILSRGQSQRGYGFEQHIQPTRIILVSSLPKIAPNDYALGICQSGYAPNQPLAHIKHCNRLEQILARAEMTQDECLMLDKNGGVISVTQGNIFAIKSGVLLTPDLAECGIEGTRRAIVLKIAAELGLTINLGTLTLHTLCNCDEVFITNSVMGIQSVRKIQQHIFTQRQITHQLAQVYNQYTNERKNHLTLTFRKAPLKKIAAFALAMILAWSYWANTLKTTDAVVYHLPQGASATSIAVDLAHQGLVNSSVFVIIMTKILGDESTLKSGYYDIHPNMSVIDVLSDFSSAKVASRNITLVEGETVSQYYQQLTHTQSLKTQGSFAQTMKMAGIKKPYEGYFWPDTYRVDYGDSVASVFKRAYQALQQKLTTEWQGRDKKHPLKTAEEALVLASLIEKETAHKAEKSKISGVFMNRLQKNMRLQTDPTVAYALGKAYTGKLSKQDLRFNSPYNTYRHQGLPPTAISSVGQTSLQAAMHPEKTDYLYFVAKKDGTHVFAKTYQQHKDNINQYLKKSTP